MRIEMMRRMLQLAAATAVLLLATSASSNEPLCEETKNPTCDVVDFESMSTGNQGNNFVQNGFDFQYISGPSSSGFTTGDESYLGRGLYFWCYTSKITLPQPREYVTFTYAGFSSTVEFLAVDGSGMVLDSEVHENHSNLRDGEAQSVTLWGVEDQIEAIYLHHVDDAKSCTQDCGEPFLGEVRACSL